MKKNQSALVSINIGTYNSMKTLKECLESIRRSTYKNVEIIGLDSWSTDGTVELLKEYGALVVFAPTLGEARKLGAEQSKGAWILLVDSDQVLNPDLIERCVTVAELEDCDAITFHEEALTQTNSFIERVHQYDKELFHNARDCDATFGDAIPRFFRAFHYKAVDFTRNPPQTMEHNSIWEQLQRLDIKRGWIDTVAYHHDPSTTKELFQKFYRNGLYYLDVLKHHKKLALFHSLPRRTYFTWRALSQPAMFLGLWYMYFVKAIATVCGIVVYLVKGRKR